ncbi:PAS domain S-box protein, partial [Massilia arenosa]
MSTYPLWQLFAAPADTSMLAYGQYDPVLVVLSLLIAIFASWMGLQMAGLANDRRVPRAIVLLSGSLALGSGVWAMHFIGMLAFNLCTRVEYDPLITLGSGLPSVAASFVALNLIGRDQLSRWQLLAGGVLVGAGIGAMHYTGMAAMRMSLVLHYDPYVFGLSIVVAVVLATLALWVRYGLRGFAARLGQGRILLLAAIVMGCAIAGMHYTGMAAARFAGTVDQTSSGTANANFLALSITCITVAFTAFVLAVNGLLRYRAIFIELRQTQDWTQEMLSTTVDGVITVNGDGMIEGFNTSAERIYRWRAQDAIGQHISALIAEPAQDNLLDVLRAGRPGIAQQTSEVLGLRRDGTVVPVRRTLGHARLGERERFVCFITDISERRAMEQALRDSERQFRSLIGNLPGISYRSLAQDCRPMVFVSDAVERITGYPAADFTGAAPLRSIDGLVEPHDRARVAAAVAGALRTRQPYLVEYALRHADGSLRWLWENGTPVADDDGAVRWLDGVILDMTERRAMEEALREAKEKAEQAAAARAAFVANMSHEIRTPMNSILGFTDVLLDSPLSPEQRHQLDTVRNAGRSLLRLLNEILDTAKLDKGAVELEITDFNLLTLIEELSSTLSPNAHAKGLQLDMQYDPQLPAWIRGDELRVRQVLTNILDNAIKFTEHGSVTLKARAVQGQLHFTIQDSGIGIAADRLHAIFDPFTQADASMTRRYGGTGLGTTISRQLVELMGGTIRVESTLGQGTTFHIQLPLVPGRAAQVRPGLRGEAQCTMARACSCSPRCTRASA